MLDPRHILITGASSGLGAALAAAYAAPGRRLSLAGRSAERLSAVADHCRDVGAEVEAAVLDITDPVAMADWMVRIDKTAPLDLVIANAGISGGTYGGSESEAQVRAIFAANVDGVLNTVLPVLPLMEARRRGQIALMASLAAHRGFPSAPAYCASKAAVKIWGEALRGQLAPHGVAVNVIMPGYVKSPMTDANDFTMPFLMSAQRAASIIRDGLARNRARIAFPWPMTMIAWLLGTLHPALTDPLLRRLPKKR
ncbi:SDR family NAD(P)-dependent oxidoreductase [Dongia soli]|uniref:SDR family NAD(P)-dependent oxidoreductase n=1 Tax=Dongia soli TaxID=600628 RepID=A0ABU5ECJ3_9PROT|nr:SDR family NAD(P)-dependent oxidoreductase [Dongia soli]MDY0884027.1 SDR family NAD(P)-dependent oxidoreductase [Dongia soli]